MPTNTPDLKAIHCLNAECHRELVYTDGAWLIHGVRVGGVFVEVSRELRTRTVTLRCPCGTERKIAQVKAARVSIVSGTSVAVGV